MYGQNRYLMARTLKLGLNIGIIDTVTFKLISKPIALILIFHGIQPRLMTSTYGGGK